MLRTETSKTRKESFDVYREKTSKYLKNRELEWLIEHGQIRESVYFKGAIGDRYTIYIATKRAKNLIDISTVYNSLDYGTLLGTPIGTLRGYILEMRESNDWGSRFYHGIGYSFRQLMRQGVISKKNPWKIRFCRSAYFCRLNDSTEFTPWKGMKINIKDGTLVNKPNKLSVADYSKAKDADARARKANRLANKNNADAIARYRKAGGDTKEARPGWRGEAGSERWMNAVAGAGTENINWDMIPIDDIFKHRNVTLRSNILEHYGIEKLLETLKHNVIDIDFIDGREYKLLDVTIPDNSGSDRLSSTAQGLYLQMINPSTGENHFEGIANVSNWGGPKEATVKEALAWRDGDAIMQDLDSFSNRNDASSKIVYIAPTKLT